jgi:glutathione S-transferase
MRLTTFKWVPEPNQGHVKDHRVRWACEEAGLQYEVRLIEGKFRDSQEYRKQQPFGQVPVLEDGALTLFESGAIALYLAEKSEILMPKDTHEKARVMTWVFAALNSLEPAVQKFNDVADNYPQEEWTKSRYPVVRAALEKRLRDLSQWLSDKEYLQNRFTVADIMMSTVLRDLKGMGVLEEFPVISNYWKRCEDRPAFQKAISDQLKVFKENSPK